MKNYKLPEFLKPNFKTSLKRMGRNNDGGYCVPIKAVQDSSSLFSFGMFDDWSFEESFNKENRDAKIIVYDGSVNNFFWFKQLIKNIINLITLKVSFLFFFKECFIYFNYLSFFSSKNIIHEKKFIVTSKYLPEGFLREKVSNIKDILKENEDKDYFFKIDIEGSEYRILDDILENQNNLLGMVIEFHNSDLMINHIDNFIKNLKLELVHIHVNNYGEVNHNNFPTVLELTFCNKKYNVKRSEHETIFPDLNIDQPNNKNKKDLNIEFIKY